MNEALRPEGDLRTLLDQLPVGLLWHDERGRILGANAWVASLLGYSLNDLLGASLWNVIRIPEQREHLVATYESLLPESADAALLIVLNHVRGHTLAVQVDLRCEFDPVGQPRRFAWAVRLPDFVTARVASSMESLARASAKLEELVKAIEPSNRQLRESGLRPVSLTPGQFPPRERQVVELVLAGNPPTDVAKRLGMSAQTVRKHLRNACKRSNVASTAELVRRLGGDPDALVPIEVPPSSSIPR